MEKLLLLPLMHSAYLYVEKNRLHCFMSVPVSADEVDGRALIDRYATLNVSDGVCIRDSICRATRNRIYHRVGITQDWDWTMITFSTIPISDLKQMPFAFALI